MKSKLLVPMLALLLAACGGGDDAPGPAPIPVDAINPEVFRTMSAADDQFCFNHAGVFSQRELENLDAVAHPEIIQTTFKEEVVCNDGVRATRNFVIRTGELVTS